MSASILVTGASGAIGGAVTGALAAAGQPVAPTARSASLVGGLTARYLDYDDPGCYAAALSGITSVFLVMPSGDPHSPERVAPFVRAAAGAGVRHIVVNSAIMASVDEHFTLRRIERLVESCGTGWTHLRSAWYMSSLTSGIFAPMLAAGELALPTGTSRCAFVDPDDFAAAAVAVLTSPTAHDGAVYTLTGPEAVDWPTAVRLCAHHLGRPMRYRAVSEEEYGEACRRAGVPEESVDLLLGLFAAGRDGRTARVQPDLRRLIARRPRTLAEFLADVGAREHAAGVG